MRTLCAGILLVASAAVLPAARNLEIYSIDVEGGQATLIVSPSGESMVVDTGWGGHNKRDAERLAACNRQRRPPRHCRRAGRCRGDREPSVPPRGIRRTRRGGPLLARAADEGSTA